MANPDGGRIRLYLNRIRVRQRLIRVCRWKQFSGFLQPLAHGVIGNDRPNSARSEVISEAAVLRATAGLKLYPFMAMPMTSFRTDSRSFPE